MTDEQVRALALGNWHKLNSVLVNSPSRAELARMLVLELTSEDPRPEIVERLRSAVARCDTVAGREAARRVMLAAASRGRPTIGDLNAMGLRDADALLVCGGWRRVRA
jgi:hypothetical protein